MTDSFFNNNPTIHDSHLRAISTITSSTDNIQRLVDMLAGSTRADRALIITQLKDLWDQRLVKPHTTQWIQETTSATTRSGYYIDSSTTSYQPFSTDYKFKDTQPRI